MKKVILFGSRARGDYHRPSDIDLIVYGGNIAEFALDVEEDRALALMRDEMEHSEDSLSLAMYEYSGTCSNDRMNYFNRIGEKKWSDLIEYGIVRGEFNTVNVKEIVHVILYAYQGVRMWSRIVSMTPEVYDSITNHIRKQLIKEQ